ncbi:hypothetical protein ACFL6S_03780 [Candidatus Poribacteria bacterium]
MKRFYFILMATLVITVLACDKQTTPPFFEVVETEEGTDADGYAYIDITVENVSNGAGKGVTCIVTVTEERSNEILAEKTVLFARGGIIEREEQAVRKVVLYHISALEPLIEYETVETGTGTERIPLEPIITFSFDLSWEDVGLQLQEIP